jgi:hypothetical protein
MITILSFNSLLVRPAYRSPLRVDPSICQYYPRCESRSILPWWNVRLSRDFELLGHSDQIGERVGTHLSHHAATVHFDCLLGGPKLAGDLLVQEASNNERQDLVLAWSEGRKPFLELEVLRPLLADFAIAEERLFDRVE